MYKEFQEFTRRRSCILAFAVELKSLGLIRIYHVPLSVEFEALHCRSGPDLWTDAERPKSLFPIIVKRSHLS
jgi:hypothetical protein